MLKMITTAALLGVLIGGSIVLHTSPTRAAELFGFGQKCSDGSAADVGTPEGIAKADARCESQKCYPGPAAAGQPLPWYCMNPKKNCAKEYSDGATAVPGQAPIMIGNVPYSCQCPPAIEGRCRFVPQ
jgi:hypothetical protein